MACRRALRALAVSVGLLVVPGCLAGSTDSEPTADPVVAVGGASPTLPSPDRGAANGSWWRPAAGLTWQWQLSGRLDPAVKAQVFDVDLFETTAEQVTALHQKGAKVICYVNAGSWEAFRPDAASYPAALLGRDNGWQDERWLDIRQLAALEPLLAARFDQCRDKGFDGVEPDYMDAWTDDASGFPLSRADQLAFDRMLIRLGHERGLAVGLKNGVELVDDLVDEVDFAVNEECARYEECDRLAPIVAAGKPVFHVEYDLDRSAFCAQTAALGFSSLVKRLELDAYREPC